MIFQRATMRYFIFFGLFNLLLIKNHSCGKTFRAAVFAHNNLALPPYSKLGNFTRADAERLMQSNLAVYEKQMEKAQKEKVNIIVFPEYGLYGFGFDAYSREVVLQFTEDIPDPKEVTFCPCGNEQIRSSTPILYEIGCLAKKYELYTVVNMADVKKCEKNCRKDGLYIFNTNVIFNSKGCLIARYHKHHLIFENFFDVPLKKEYIYFDTEFGGRFGTFICFDAQFYTPGVILVKDYNVKNIVYPTAWNNGLPVIASVQFHTAWARAYNVNYLSANVQNYPEHGITGSGIYTPDGPLIQYWNTSSLEDKLFITDVPLIENAKSDPVLPKLLDSKPTSQAYFYGSVYGNKFKATYLTEVKGYAEVCYKDVCCYLDYEYLENKSSNDTYLFIATEGIEKIVEQWHHQICAIILCPEHDEMDCGRDEVEVGSNVFTLIDLRARFSESAVIFPQISLSNVEIMNANEWSFSREERRMYMKSASAKKPLLSASLYGRDYGKDIVPYDGTNSASQNNFFIICTVIMISFLKLMNY